MGTKLRAVWFLPWCFGEVIPVHKQTWGKCVCSFAGWRACKEGSCSVQHASYLPAVLVAHWGHRDDVGYGMCAEMLGWVRKH